MTEAENRVADGTDPVCVMARNIMGALHLSALEVSGVSPLDISLRPEPKMRVDVVEVSGSGVQLHVTLPNGQQYGVTVYRR